jgi:hypothetical protein
MGTKTMKPRTEPAENSGVDGVKDQGVRTSTDQFVVLSQIYWQQSAFPPEKSLSCMLDIN